MNQLVAIISCIIFLPLLAVAEDAQRGRTADGRAFRTADDGTQLVDYIAELELNVENLKAQVSGLEIDLQDKQDQIDRASNDSNAIAERDIVPIAKIECPRTTCPPVDCTGLVQSATKSLDLKISELQQNLRAQSDQTLNIKTTSASECAEKIRTATMPLEESITDLRARVDAQTVGYADDIARQRTQLAALQERLTSKENEIGNLQAKLNEALQAKNVDVVPVAASQIRGSLRDTTSPVAVIPASDALTRARSRAVDSVRIALATDLKNIDKRIIERADLFKRYGSISGTSSGLIRVSPSNLVSSRGRTVEYVRTNLNKAKTFSDIASLQRDLQEIKRKLESDISFIQRMSAKKGN